MTFWLIAILILLVQETFTTTGLMVSAYKESRNLLLFTLIFFAATIIEIFLFHRFGKYLQTKGKYIKSVIWTTKHIAKADYFIGLQGKKIFLFLLAASVFPPSLTAFISSWLELPLKQKFLCIIGGNILWYIGSWMIVLSVSSFVQDTRKAIFCVLIISFTYVIIKRIIYKKFTQKS